MKKLKLILVISLTSILLLSGTLVVSGMVDGGGKICYWKNHLTNQVDYNSKQNVIPLCPYEGNTPGFWKNHLNLWVGYTTDQLIDDVFDIPSGIIWYILIGSKTLLQALNFKGGPGVFGAARILLRAAVAGLLNAAHPDVNYLYTYGDIQWLVKYSLSTGKRNIILQKEALIDAQNNLGSDL